MAENTLAQVRGWLQGGGGSVCSPSRLMAENTLAQVRGWLQARDVVRVCGSDATTYLQGQVSQDIKSLRAGQNAWSLLLAPRGKINAWFRVTRREDGFLLDVDSGFADALVARLKRFMLGVEVLVEPLQNWQMLVLRNDSMGVVSCTTADAASTTDAAGVADAASTTDAADVAATTDAAGVADAAATTDAAGVADAAATTDAAGVAATTDAADVADKEGYEAQVNAGVFNAEVRATVWWPGFEGKDFLGPGLTIPPGLMVLSENDFQVARIRAGWPLMGRELTERTIPAEVTGLVECSVSFTKGCYTGQELVARIDSRGGKVPRPLRFLEINCTSGVSAGDEIVVEDEIVGKVTSVAVDGQTATSVALGVVHRRLQPPATATVQGYSATVTAL